MACCPFHDDKNPSMKVDQRFHCFGCGADGDVIDFIAKLFDLSPKEAAEKLAQDFGLIYDSQAPPRRRYVRQKTEAQKFRENRQRCYRVLSDYYYLLKKWEADRSPRTPEEEPHPRFVELTEDGRLMLTEEKGLNFTGGFSTLSQFLQEQRKDRHTEEVEAESISYAVCKYFGIETGENSFGYIASWSQGKELKELRASLETINKTSGTLISDIERHYKEICKERGIDPHAKVEPEPAPIEQPEDVAKVSDRQQTGDLTYYVAECMEFPNLGEYHDNLSLEEAIRIYQEIPAERMNGIKGIGFELKDGSDYEGPFPILTGQTIDLDTIQAIDYYRDNPLAQKAVKELAAAMPEMEVLGADANQQEALFLIDDATYLHKCRYMDEITGNRGVIFATGTPVSNSMTELYTMQRYLQYDRLQELNMTHFDCWASRFGETVTALELAPEGTGYRARTRFSKFFNLPELMNLFKEVADIKTADQLNLPTPEVEYHNIVAQPTEHQQEMVKTLSERASLVHSGTVDPSQDNMLKITSDGRKLGLDQRIVNQMLPDEPGTKVNQCVDNIMQIWRDGKADKLTQLVFCDISTPQAKAPASKAAKTLDNPLLHALEGAVPLPEQEPVFTVYDDIRQKLIAQGMPADQIAFIHEANTEVRKKELFSKVRTGQVRVLMGSTAKMGAGTNVQDRLVALHDLDCPWRPGDLAQRKGRIERQGNQNPIVHVYRYVTEGTFDAYLWQTVENKQKFISQIMTSKSPVRSCDDVDETALSFAEIKALCAGDPRIKERMDLDVEVSRLKLMKADHQSKQYRLEDQLLKYFPEEIEKHKGFIKGFESDLEVLAAHPHPEDGFAGMEIRGDLLTDKENAGAALLDACKEVKTSDPVQIGSYRGYAMSVEFSAWKQKYTLLLKGQMTHRATLGTDPRGNLTRIDNALAQMPQRLEAAKAQLDNLCQQQAAAKEEVGKPFLYEEELRSKNARLVELDTLLNIDGKGPAHDEAVVAKSTRSSVLDHLKRPVPPRSTDKKPKQHEEVR